MHKKRKGEKGMKKKKVNALLAYLLAFSMILSQPIAAFAEETAETVVETESSAETETKAEEIDTDETVAESSSDTETTAGEKGTEAIPEEDAAEEDSTEQIKTEEATTEEAAAEETTSEETTTEEAAEEEVATEEAVTEEESTIAEGVQILSVEKQKELNALGFKTMSLSDDMIAEKANLSQVASSMKSMKADEDYIEHEIVYTAEDEEQARKIAECYGGELEEFEYGIAVASIEETVSNAVGIAADTEVWLPAVYPNIVYTISGEYTVLEAAADTDEAVLIDEADVEHETITDAAELEVLFPSADEHLYATAPNDTYFDSQWHHDAMNTVEAWNASKGKGVTVAVIDSGIDYEHPDLKGNIEGHISTIGGTGRDDNGHGTHCAGIIAATAGNNIGVSGVAPDAKIYSVKVMDSEGSGKTADIIQGVIAATDEDVDVISMSLGGICWDGLFQSKINEAVDKGIVVVAAAGNEGVSQKSYPAAYDNVIAVAATDYDNDLTYFSNYGSWVDIAAPGYNILSTLPTDFTVADCEYAAAGYGYMSGTSMACPAVAGTVALMLGNSEELRNNNSKSGVSKIASTLLNSAVPNGSMAYYTYNYYSFSDAEAATYAVENGSVEIPEISFGNGTLDNKNVVTITGGNAYFELKTKTEHAKIYYTINGKKPTAEPGQLYTGKIFIHTSGKYKIQAVAVVGNKSSKVLSQSYKLDVKATELSASGDNNNMTVAIGKSIQLSVDIAPSYVSSKKLIWSCDDTTGMIKVGKSNGKVTCNKKAKAGKDFSAKVTATTTDGSGKSVTFTVTPSEDKIEELSLNKETLNMIPYWTDIELNADKKEYVRQYPLVPQNGDVKPTQYIYKSSNTKVATVDANGVITAQNKGKANITVMANDGSGKKAVCKVTVVTPVFDFYTYSSTGYSDKSSYIPIATGCTITMKSVINYNYSPYKPTNAKLTWSSNSKDVTVSNGKVKCAANAKAGTTATITVEAADGLASDCKREITFIVTDKIDKLLVKNGDKKYISSMTIQYLKEGDDIWEFGVGDFIYCPLSAGIMRADGKAGENGKYYGDMWIDVSNRDVVYRYYDSKEGVIIVGTKPGSSKVTYTSRDGSNAKFTINFKVVARDSKLSE